MKIAIIQSGNSGFFPRFYKLLCNAIEENKDKCILLVPNSGRNKRCTLPNQIIWGTRFNWFIHSICYRITGLQDIFSLFETFHLIYILKHQKPDVINFNMINDKCLNIPLLVRYINKHNIPIIWTMHDCRAFTGQCSYFDEIGCYKWKNGCGQCPQCETWIDNTKTQWKIRKKWNTAFKHLTIVTPSEWLASFVKNSMFEGHTVKVIYNGVDTNNFSRKTDLNIRIKYNIGKSKKIVLGCAINWESRKGLTYFEHLSEMLLDNYQIVLVGNIRNDIKEKLTSKNIICVGRTSSIEEMIAWYQEADVFCNPTLADNFPTTNIESLASGTPIVTFRTGGSPEAIDEHTGIIVEKGDIQALCDAVIKVAENRNYYTSEKCIIRSKSFSKEQYQHYVKLYHEIEMKL